MLTILYAAQILCVEPTEIARVHFTASTASSETVRMTMLESGPARSVHNDSILVKPGMQAFGFDGVYLGIVRGSAGGRLYVIAEDGAALCLPPQLARVSCGGFVLLGGTARDLRAAHTTRMIRSAPPYTL